MHYQHIIASRIDYCNAILYAANAQRDVMVALLNIGGTLC